jgi:hypothetical protein
MYDLATSYWEYKEENPDEKYGHSDYIFIHLYIAILLHITVALVLQVGCDIVLQVGCSILGCINFLVDLLANGSSYFSRIKKLISHLFTNGLFSAPCCSFTLDGVVDELSGVVNATLLCSFDGLVETMV